MPPTHITFQPPTPFSTSVQVRKQVLLNIGVTLKSLLDHYQSISLCPQSMETPTFPTNKRHAMFFRRRASPPNQELITASFPNPKANHLSPSNVSISTYRTPKTIEEALTLSNATPPRPPPHRNHVADHKQPPPLDRAQSSEYFLEIRKSLGSKEPKSRKTGHGRIHTDATETQPAFESDAFAVQMPTTREPILDTPVYRAKLPSPSKAQVEAYRTYERKAQQVRERNNSEGVRVPSQIMSYDCAFASHPMETEVERPAPSSPPQFFPAGSFPISPPLPQHTWSRANRPSQVERQDQRSTSDSTTIPAARKPLGIGHSMPARSRYHQRGDTSMGASVSHTLPTPTPSPSKIKIRLKPRAAAPAPAPAPTPALATAPPSPDRPQKESFWSLYTRTPPHSTPDTSRSPSPTKPPPHFAYTNTNVSAGAAEALFGYPSKDIIGTAALEKEKAKKKDKDVEKEKDSEGATKSRWAWLRSAGPRVAKPTAVATTPSNASGRLDISAPITSVYIDPFTQHTTPIPTQPSTPPPSRPTSPRKLARSKPAPAPASTGKFESGFAQVTSLTSLVLKACLLIYVLVGLYFILDAIREAVHAIGTPFRVVRVLLGYLWMGIVWAVKRLGRGWERWGVRVALKGGWRGTWW